MVRLQRWERGWLKLWERVFCGGLSGKELGQGRQTSEVWEDLLDSVSGHGASTALHCWCWVLRAFRSVSKPAVELSFSSIRLTKEQDWCLRQRILESHAKLVIQLALVIFQEIDFE